MEPFIEYMMLFSTPISMLVGGGLALGGVAVGANLFDDDVIERRRERRDKRRIERLLALHRRPWISNKKTQA